MAYMVMYQFDLDGVNFIDEYNEHSLKEIKREYHHLISVAIVDLQTKTLVYMRGYGWFINNAFDIIERYLKHLNR